MRLPVFLTTFAFIAGVRCAATPTSRIAIIGAGAGGSSSAFWISKAQERWGLSIAVDIFEKNDYVGGRSNVVTPYSNGQLENIEIGGSIFLDANLNMQRATAEFGLDGVIQDDEGSDGVWDGNEFRITSFSGDAGQVARYGEEAFDVTGEVVEELEGAFLGLYGQEAGIQPFPNIATVVEALNWTVPLETLTTTYFDHLGVNALFTREQIESGLRVNYGQSVSEAHVMASAITLAADDSDATSIRGGNRQIFQQFIQNSGATLHLDTTVLRITEQSHKYSIQYKTGSATRTQTYDYVILAAPYHLSGISLDLDSPVYVPAQPYVNLHVTLVSTPAEGPLDPQYFHVRDISDIPQNILTTFEGLPFENPEFNSLNYLGKLVLKGQDTPANLTQLNIGHTPGRDISGEEYVVKIFSAEQISDQWLHAMFNGQVGWVYRTQWDAYPYLTPTKTFPPIQLSKGFYYVNAFEPVFSTMESETVASRNVVELLLQQQFNASICHTLTPPDQIDPTAYVYGWDC